MTEYKFTSTTEPPTFSRSEVEKRKEKRRKVLEAVRERRKINYTNFYKKIQTQT